MSNLKHEEIIKKWANTYQLHQENNTWWKEDALVVAGDNNLKRGVISAFHDPPYRGHPGIGNTVVLLKQSYWWPNMKKDVEEYVKGCATCQANKINTHHQKPHLYPITTDPKRNLLKSSQWTSLPNSHHHEDMTQSSESQTMIVRKQRYSYPAMKQSQAKELQSCTCNTFTPITAYQKDSSWTGDHNSYQSS